MERVDVIRYFTFRKLKYMWKSDVEEWISPADLDGEVGGRIHHFCKFVDLFLPYEIVIVLFWMQI